MATDRPLAYVLKGATRHLFFTGKGGVGKTSMACTAAVALAEAGKRVLLVSTDPASNLDEVLETALTSEPIAIAAVTGLWAMNLDPEAAARAHRDRVVGPYRGVLPEAVVASMEEQLSGACTVEIAAFDAFTRLLAEPALTERFEHVVFDTAPTGHTLRLLTLPSAWTDFIQSNMTGVSCLGPLAGLKEQQALYEASAAGLANPALTTLVLVSRPEVSALAEAERTRCELAALGVSNQHLIINGLFEPQRPEDAVASAMAERARFALDGMSEGLAALPCTTVPLRPLDMVGIAALRSLASEDPTVGLGAPLAMPVLPEHASFQALIDSLSAAGHGVIMTMGKGGVGKTTIAAAVALELAARGYRVHLTTTDPAAHVAAAVGEPVAGLTVGRIDPAEETRRYTEETMARAGAGLDANGRALLEEDLRSPCTEEIAVFNAFARAVAKGQDGVVILDTAPTGHTLLLLDASESYHREVARNQSEVAPEVRELLPRLRDRDYTRVLIVTLPEPTPVHEARRLQADLERAGIKPYAWVVNRSLARSETQDPILRARAAGEGPYIREVLSLAEQAAVLPWIPGEPSGEVGLRSLAYL